MSQENVARTPLSNTHNRSRTLYERLMLRLPRLFRAVGRVMLRLPVTSRFRQTLISRSISQGLDAVNRRDFEAVLPKYNPAVLRLSGDQAGSASLAALLVILVCAEPSAFIT